jgi:hypothetical protein
MFQTSDPTSPEWRKAWQRFLAQFWDLPDTDYYKEFHHRGWRAGVSSVRKHRLPATCPRSYVGNERRAWEHGAVAGRQAAKAYLEVSGKDASKLR